MRKQFINKGIKIFLEELKDLEDNYLEQYSSLKKRYPWKITYIKEYNYSLLVQDAFTESVLQIKEETSLDFLQKYFYNEVKSVSRDIKHFNSMEDIALIVCYNVFKEVIDIENYDGILMKFRVDLERFNRKIIKDLYKKGALCLR